MTQPDELKSPEPLLWSAGNGADVWALIQAAMSGDVPTIQRLVEQDPRLVRSQFRYRTPLYFAVRENQRGAAEYLLDQGADPIGLAVNDSLLEICRDRGYSDLERLLESKLVQLHHASGAGEPVAAAIRARDVAEVGRLLDKSPELLHAGDRRSNQPIHWAVMTRQLELIDQLLARGADINARRQDGARPIQLTNGDYTYRGWRDVPADTKTTPEEVLAHLRTCGAYVDINTASSIGDLDRVRELVDADPSIVNRVSEYVTYYIGSGAPLKNAAARGHIEVVRLLLERGADPNLPEEGIAPKGHSLYSAVYYGHHDVARRLLEHGADPSPPVESSADALSMAISKNDVPMIELLCSYGSHRSVELLAYYGDVMTASAVFAARPSLANDPVAFQNAVSQGREAFVRLMLRHQPRLANQTVAWVEGDGTLGSARARELTEFLFASGMNPSTPDWLGITPLHEFARKGDLENAGIFLDHGADLGARDEDICSTPLGWAAKFGRREMVALLLSRGAAVNSPNDPHWATPLAWATRRGHDEIADILREHGARS
jgi:ankyrin repeat protein